MLRRGGLALLVGTSLLAGQALASAAPRPVCRLLIDARGDASYDGVLPGDVGDDLLSADVASDGRTVTAVLRLADVLPSDPAAPDGRGYTLFFTVHSSTTPYFLEARTYATGTRFVYGDVPTELNLHGYERVLGEARGVIDVAHHEVRIHAPAIALGGKGGLRKGVILHDLSVAVARLVGQGVAESQVVAGLEIPLSGAHANFDVAASDRARYVVGTASCVRPGA